MPRDGTGERDECHEESSRKRRKRQWAVVGEGVGGGVGRGESGDGWEARINDEPIVKTAKSGATRKHGRRGGSQTLICNVIPLCARRTKGKRNGLEKRARACKREREHCEREREREREKARNGIVVRFST